MNWAMERIEVAREVRVWWLDDEDRNRASSIKSVTWSHCKLEINIIYQLVVSCVKVCDLESL